MVDKVTKWKSSKTLNLPDNLLCLPGNLPPLSGNKNHAEAPLLPRAEVKTAADGLGEHFHQHAAQS